MDSKKCTFRKIAIYFSPSNKKKRDFSYEQNDNNGFVVLVFNIPFAILSKWIQMMGSGT